MTHRQARKRLGTRTSRRSGTKTQAIPGQTKPSKKGALVKYRHPRRRVGPSLASRVWALIRG